MFDISVHKNIFKFKKVISVHFQKVDILTTINKI